LKAAAAKAPGICFPTAALQLLLQAAAYVKPSQGVTPPLLPLLLLSARCLALSACRALTATSTATLYCITALLLALLLLLLLLLLGSTPTGCSPAGFTTLRATIPLLLPPNKRTAPLLLLLTPACLILLVSMRTGLAKTPNP
jgi:hypothetical protein